MVLLCKLCTILDPIQMQNIWSWSANVLRPALSLRCASSHYSANLFYFIRISQACSLSISRVNAVAVNHGWPKPWVHQDSPKHPKLNMIRKGQLGHKGQQDGSEGHAIKTPNLIYMYSRFYTYMKRGQLWSPQQTPSSCLFWLPMDAPNMTNKTMKYVMM